MFSSRGWMRFALVLNLLGTGLLFFSFQATSSNVRIIRTKQGQTALCVDKTAILVVDREHSGLTLGMPPCPEWENARPTAVVNIEKPWLVTIGFLVLSFGFLLQFLSIPSPKTMAQMRTELREIEKAEKLRKKLERQKGDASPRVY